MSSSAQVLVLNRAWAPVAITTCERAFGLLFSGAAKALDKDLQTFDFPSWSALAAEVGDDVIHTPRSVLRIPRIVVLQLYDKLPRRMIRFSRQNVYLRDNFTCGYCGHRFARKDLNLDHVVPKSKGGKTTWENVLTTCITCNTRKANKTLAEAGLALKRAPKRPMISDLAVRAKGRVHAEWLPFLDVVSASYWNTELIDD